MNTSATGARLRVTGLLRAAYRWLRDEPETAPVQPAPPSPPVSPPPPLPPVKSPLAGKPSPSASRVRVSAAPGGEVLPMPWQAVINNLQPELKIRVRQQPAGERTLSLPVTQVMAQLVHGAVKISFGELRRAAPDLFTPSTDHDQVMVLLPLGEILPRINLSKLGRRSDQRLVEVPEEIASPFDANGNGLSVSTGSKPQSWAPSARGMSPAGPAQFAGTAGPTSAAGVPPVRHAPIPPLMPPRAVAPAAPFTPESPAISRPTSVTPSPKPAHSDSLVSPVTPATVSPPPPPPKAAGGNGQSVPSYAQHAAFVMSQPQPGPSPAGTADCLQVPLTSLINSWPQPVRLEIAQMSAVDSTIAFPVDMLEKGLRVGKVSFPWRLARAWIHPAVPPHVSAHDGTPLEIPLNIIAPLFVERRKSAGSGQRRVAVDETIPNLFFNGTPPATTAGISNAAPVTAPAPAKTPDTNYFVWGDSDDARPRVEQGAPAHPVPGTDFTRRFATPNEVVKRAMTLNGVVGALVALPDGLKVSSDVPADLNADTLAAFLPQLFGKVSQASKELRMGELNNLNFTVGNVPWKIFRVHSVYFAAFGRAGEALPTGQLAVLAAELDRKPRAA